MPTCVLWHPIPLCQRHRPRSQSPRTTPTANHRQRAGQPEAELGGGLSGSRPSSRGQHPQSIPPPCRTQFTHLEARDGGSLTSKALTSLRVSSACLLYIDGFIPQILRAYCVPGTVRGTLLFSLLQGPSSSLDPKSQLPRPAREAPLPAPAPAPSYHSPGTVI